MSLVQEIIFSVHEDIHNIQCCMIKDIVFNLQSSILRNHNNYLSIAHYLYLITLLFLASFEKAAML